MSRKYHMLAFAGSVAQNAVLANVPLLVDNYVSQQGSAYVFRESLKILGIYCQIDSGTNAQLFTPRFREMGPNSIVPISTSAAPPNLPPVYLPEGNGPLVTPLDPFNVQVSRTGAGAANCYSLLWVSDRAPTRDYRECRTLRATSATVFADATWTQGTFTFDQTLPSGRYDILGMDIYGTNLLAARLVFPDGQAKPGVIAQQSIAEYNWQYWRFGNQGVLGSFDSTAIPYIEMMGTGVGTTQTLLLDLVRVGDVGRG